MKSTTITLKEGEETEYIITFLSQSDEKYEITIGKEHKFFDGVAHWFGILRRHLFKPLQPVEESIRRKRGRGRKRVAL